jgi:hypothetical protein
MIQKDDIPRLLLDACPSFAPIWQEFVDEWKDEPEPPLYLALAEFCRHIIAMLANNDTGRFPMIFETIERMHIAGDGYVKEAATVGLLESLQNTNLHTSTKPEQFRSYLKPISEKWWDKLYDFWEKGTLLTED